MVLYKKIGLKVGIFWMKTGSIVWKTVLKMGIVQVGIVWGGNCPGGNCPGGNCPVGIVRVGVVPAPMNEGVVACF